MRLQNVQREYCMCAPIDHFPIFYLPFSVVVRVWSYFYYEANVDERKKCTYVRTQTLLDATTTKIDGEADETRTIFRCYLLSA